MKWQIPKALPILGIWHVVEIRPFTDEEAADAKNGLYLDTQRAIVIEACVPEHLRYEVLCHEVAEAVNDMLDLGLKHYQVSAMGVGFHDVMRNQLKEVE